MTSMFVMHPDAAEKDPEWIEVESGSEPGLMMLLDGDPVTVTLTVHDSDGGEFKMWMGLDTSRPINFTARQFLADMAGVHLVCLGPVMIEGMPREMVDEWWESVSG